MNEQITACLTSPNHQYACAFADRIISESKETDEWYKEFDAFASLLYHPNSLVRNRALHILSFFVAPLRECAVSIPTGDTKTFRPQNVPNIDGDKDSLLMFIHFSA